MRRYLLALVCVCAAAGVLAASSSSSLAWRRFKGEHAKVYGPEEDAMRFANFLTTKQLVERHNANPNATFKLGLNHMADWTREERQKLTGNKLGDTHRLGGGSVLSPKLAKLLDGSVPEEVDWRRVPNRVTAVKDQGNCASGWAFAATGLLEGQQTVLNMSGLIPLSAQELIDCSPSNLGCSGGYTMRALHDIGRVLDGIESEADYPYEAKLSKCRMDKSKSVMTTQGGSFLEYMSEEALMKAVANYGPVAVAVIPSDKFVHYSSGIFDDPDCESKTDIHPVLVVGYGTDPKGGDYWLVKNSWSVKWGEEGYIRMRRGVDLCDIADYGIVARF